MKLQSKEQEHSVSPEPPPIPILEFDSEGEESPPIVTPVGTLLASFKRFTAKTIGEALTRAWSLTKPVEVKELKDNVFVFHFSSISEKERILAGSPWNFAGFLLCLIEWPPSVSLVDLKLDEASIWLQVSGLAPHMMTMRRARKIGYELIAAVEQNELPDDNSPHWDDNFRMKVVINLHRPLPTGFLHKLPGDEAHWVQF
ncbi:hypothetical protein Tsubulata_005461 [Turnera subulata]|uniref:DUF4283 domain-containing protein n=1 Tax=Turnera subulata TaxID=218843 RepID=A0A9Q0JCM7_9ROSI|nr:hypothetical protein Tsubulata_005461 [Turnera subulata]